jgi:hypothetical protein
MDCGICSGEAQEDGRYPADFAGLTLLAAVVAG